MMQLSLLGMSEEKGERISTKHNMQNLWIDEYLKKFYSFFPLLK